MDESSAGSDGWAPVELKALPLQAWEMRYKVALLIRKVGQYPESYYTVNTPAIAKKGQGNRPLDHRLLAVFCALYRIESGAWFDQLKPWLREVLHPRVVGAIAGLEACNVACESHTCLDQATLHWIAKAIAAYDYRKYFASFEHQFSCSMMAHAGMPLTLVAQTLHL